MQWLGGLIEANDVFTVLGCVFVWYGFNQIYAGLGPGLVGLYLLTGVAITQLKGKP
jgi:hypothetical protein